MSHNLSDDIIQLLNSEPIKDFLNAANNLVNLLESDLVNSTEDQYYKEIHLALLALYLTGINLPEVDLIYSDDKTGFDDAKLFENQKELNISDKLGKSCIYYQIFDPIYPAKDEPTQGLLYEDFVEIYTDIKRELQKIKIGTNEAVEDALWQLKFGVQTHWGNHCINALRALHYLKFDHKGF